MEAKDRGEKMIDEKQEVEKAKSDQDLRIGSVVELEDGKSYGAMRRVCAVKMTGWGKPHVELKAVVNCGR